MNIKEDVDYYGILRKEDVVNDVVNDIIKILQENSTYSPQIRGTLIHGAVKKIVDYFEKIHLKNEIRKGVILGELKGMLTVAATSPDDFNAEHIKKRLSELFPYDPFPNEEPII